MGGRDLDVASATRFEPGAVVLRRSRRGDLVTWVQAVLVVSDDERGSLLWMPEGSGFGYRVDGHGRAIREEPIDVVAVSALAEGVWKAAAC